MATQIKLDTKKLEQIIKAIGDQPVKRRVIHDGVEYGVHQEFSTNAGGRPRSSGRGVTGKGHPSLVPAFERHTKDLPKIVGKAIEQAIPLDSLLGKIAFDIQADWDGDVNVDTGAYKNSIKVSEG
jgi:hypothetical protein